MRKLTDRWYLVPIASMVALYACVMTAVGRADARTEEFAYVSINRVYELASKGKFDELERSGLVSAEDLKYLKMQDTCLGRVEGWVVEYVGSDSFGKSWNGSVSVTRPKAEFTEEVHGSTPHVASMRPSSGVNLLVTTPTSYSYEEDTPPGPQPSIDLSPDRPDQEIVSSAASLMYDVRPVLERFDAIKSATPRKVGEFWVVTVTAVAKSDQSDDVHTAGSLLETYYLVMSAAGRPIEYVKAPGVGVPIPSKTIISTPAHKKPHAPAKTPKAS